MKQRLDILHINHNSPGTEGLYEDEIYRSLSSLGYKQELFSHVDYPMGYSQKVFFKVAKLSSLKPRTLPLQALKFFELCFDWIYIYIYVLVHRPRMVNHSLISRFMLPERVFLSLLCNLKGVKVALTCHDVIPFGNNVDKTIQVRKKIINKVDYLIIHNEGSRENLIKYYNVAPDKIVFHPFPLMDMEKLYRNEFTKKDVDFLFTGFIRKEKGIHVLLDAWSEVHKKYPTKKLVIAGSLADDNIDLSKYKSMNIDFKLYFLSAKEYSELLFRSKCVVLPYLQGTNSGILYSAIPANCEIIASDLPMFSNEPCIKKENLFNVGDSKQLADKMVQVINNPDSSNNLSSYKTYFNIELATAYCEILKCYKE